MILHPVLLSLRRLALSSRFLPLLAALVLPSMTLVGCGSSDDAEVDVAAAPPTIVSGRYDVRGVTRASGDPDGRLIEGTVILVQEGDRYTATYELNTTWPNEGAETVADVVGVGDGSIVGGRLEGGAETQLVISTVPGVDPAFAFVPRMVTARLESTTVAKIAPDGSIEIELENRAAEGSHYEPTRTRLVGERVETRRPVPVAATQ